MLKKLTIHQILENIKNKISFSAVTHDGAFTISIDDYVPFICTAIHNGHNLRPSLRNNMILTREERWQEEDPLTGAFVSSLPIHIICNDSRYEYDLNLEPKECIYDIAWDKKVWKKTLTSNEQKVSQAKHHNFFKVLDTLITTINSLYKSCVVYDVHSYNYKLRKYPQAPLFNLGSKHISKRKHGAFINKWLNDLSQIKIPHVKNTTTENVIFVGDGYLAKHIRRKHLTTLALPTEIKKVYLDEKSGDEYPEIINALRDKLKEATLNNAAYFVDKATTLKVGRKHRLLSSVLEPETIKIDQAIYQLFKKIDILDFLNPSNTESEKTKFFSSRYRYTPKFTYKPLNINTKDIKEKLYHISLKDIKDIDIQNFYRDVVEDYASQLEMIASRDSKNFLYSSLIYYGEPDEKDLANAQYLMHCAEINLNAKDLELITAKQVAQYFTEECRRYRIDYKIDLVKNMPAMAAFSPASKRFKIKKDALFTKRFARGLAHHEVGVHAVTTFNASEQPLKILQTGFPGATTTQEGIALLSEYLSGFLDIDRMQEVALRVLAVRHMIREYDFNETFLYLIDNFNVDHEKAFYITIRVYRGGGFTKDYVYLKGFSDVLNLYKDKHAHYLLAGKTACAYLPLLEELIHRNILKMPRLISHTFRYPKKPNAILEYVINGLA
jgi:uncharacterized protein (TIGR02421 family)